MATRALYIDLCARRAGQGGKLRVLARSNEVESPRQSFPEGESALGSSACELLALSGIEDLPIDCRVEGNPRCILQAAPASSTDRSD